MKLELKHLAPYLPYDLQVRFLNTNYTLDSQFLHDIETSHGFESVKPILRPLSDLTKEIEHNGEKFVPLAEMFPLMYRKLPHQEIICNKGLGFVCSFIQGGQSLYFNTKHPLENQYQLINQAFEWHFDVFNLIESGLAIDINTIK